MAQRIVEMVQTKKIVVSSRSSLRATQNDWKLDDKQNEINNCICIGAEALTRHYRNQRIES